MRHTTTRPSSFLLYALLFLATTFQGVSAVFCSCLCRNQEVSTGETAGDCNSYCGTELNLKSCPKADQQYIEVSSKLVWTVVGCLVVAFALCVGGVVWCCCRRKQQNQAGPSVVIVQQPAMQNHHMQQQQQQQKYQYQSL
ncbi:hypothetical protein BJ741DRAFT_596572 [Chytriomyces cf. hyalinus JEL632]|nr:hypothetical protein BJ741DRAFT_596572 [Chytriomyces cf. hyalinus JEL632]